MSTFTDLEKDAASVDGFVSENGLIPTRRNGPKPSWQYLVDGWNTQINAELDRTAGVGRDNTYETTAAGLAATVDGDYFSVVSPAAENYLDLYKNNGGSAVFQKSYPSTVKIDDITSELSELMLLDGVKKASNILPPMFEDINIYSDYVENVLTKSSYETLESTPDEFLFNFLEIDRVVVNGDYISSGTPYVGATGKKLLAGHIIYNPTGESLTQNAALALNGPITSKDSFGVERVGGSDFYIVWGRIDSIPSDKDSLTVRIYINGINQTYNTRLTSFVFITDEEIGLYDGDYFGINKRSKLEYLRSDPIIDQCGANSFTDYDRYDGNPIVTDDERVTDIIPNGSCTDSKAFYNAFLFDGDQLGNYFHASVYCTDDSTATRSWRPIVYILDGGQIANTADSLNELQIKREVRENGVIRFDISGKYPESRPHTNGYGIWLQMNIQGSTNSTFGFGATFAVDTARHYGQALRPTGFLPKNEQVTGGQVVGKDEVQTLNPLWEGKNVAWIGTSIPEGRNYPQDVCAAIGANLTNLSIGGSKTPAFFYNGRLPTPSNSNNLSYYFTLLASDVQAAFGDNIGMEVNPLNYATLQPGSGFTLTQQDIDNCTFRNIENRLDPIVADTDLVVFDYGINDRFSNQPSPWESPWNVQNDGDDRNTTAAAFEFIYRRCIAINPEIKFLVVTHHGMTVGTKDCVDNQREIANRWGQPLADIAANSYLNDINTATYMQDGLHPPKGGEVDKMYARVIIDKINSI